MKAISTFKFKKSFSRGFTLVELLVVVAILGVLAVGLVAAINPIDKINGANDSKVLSDFSVVARAAEAYTTTHNGYYPASLTELQSSGELKNVPAAPAGYNAYTWTQIPSSCTGGTTCTGFTLTTNLKSSQYAATPKVIYESTRGIQCKVAASVTTCP